MPLARAQGRRPYEILPRPQPKAVPGKIEVVEFFSYGCGHCYEFHPQIKRWAASAPAGISFRRVPVAWNPPWANLARLYYTLEATGDLIRLDDAVFDTLHVKKLKMYDTRSMREWYVGQGGDAKKFMDAFNSFSVQNRLQIAAQLVEKMGVDSVPLLVVEGRYRILGDTLADQLTNLNTLIAELHQPNPK